MSVADSSFIRIQALEQLETVFVASSHGIRFVTPNQMEEILVTSEKSDRVSFCKVKADGTLVITVIMFHRCLIKQFV